ncbi:hypothetical protein BH11MYX4_BH11MYX4_68180 [soil metagenome]
MARPASSRRGLRVVLLASAIASSTLGIALISFDAAGEAPKAAEKKSDPDNVTSLSPFMQLVAKGREKYAAKDYAGAVDVFKTAVQTSPRNALGPYLLGEAYLASANLPEAEAAFNSATESDDPKTPALVRSHALFALAECYERAKKWEQAAGAWRAYAEHAAKLGADGGAHPQSAAARLKIIDDWMRLEKHSALVRQRIAAEKTDAGPPAPAVPPPPAAKN